MVWSQAHKARGEPAGLDGAEQTHERYHSADRKGLDAQNDKNGAVARLDDFKSKISGSFSGNQKSQQKTDQPFKGKGVHRVVKDGSAKPSGVQGDVYRRP